MHRHLYRQPAVEQHISFGCDKLYTVMGNKCFNCIQCICSGIDIRPSQDHQILCLQMVRINLAGALVVWRCAIFRPPFAILDFWLKLKLPINFLGLVVQTTYWGRKLSQQFQWFKSHCKCLVLWAKASAWLKISISKWLCTLSVSIKHHICSSINRTTHGVWPGATPCNFQSFKWLGPNNYHKQ